ncbi:MAG: MarR family transcriptional regulator [Candidatus Njordarchaeales archaeon]
MGKIRLGKNAIRVLIALAKLGQCHFTGLARVTGLSNQALNYSLKRLIKLGYVTRVMEGIYALSRVSPICFLSSDVNNVFYIGGLGLRNNRDTPEPIVAKELLEKNGVKVADLLVFTTADALKSWEDYAMKFKLRKLDKNALKDINVMREELKEEVTKAMEKAPVVLDCTSLNKVFTIAMYQLAQEQKLPLIYVYEDTKELIWLRSFKDVREEVMRALNERA